MARKSKIPVDVIRQVLRDQGVTDENLLTQTIARMQQEAEAQAAEVAENKEPPVKKQNVVLISDPEGKFKGVELTAFVMAISEESSVYSVVDSLASAAQNHNLTKKGRTHPLTTLNETMADCQSKLMKEAGVWPVGKREAVYVMFHDNKVNNKAGADFNE